MKLITLTLLTFILAIPAMGASPDEEIAGLLEYVEGLQGATFVRNGGSHTAKEAADHMRMKWERQKEKISTAEKFIDLCGSKSYLSGKRYVIKLKGGPEKFSDDVLRAELKRIMAAAKK